MKTLLKAAENWFLTPEQLERSRNGSNAQSQKTQREFKFDFVKIPDEHLPKLYSTKSFACFAIYCQIYKRWFRNFKYNPLRLNMTELRKMGLARSTIYHALGKLQKLGFYRVERSPGKSPLIFLTEELPKTKPARRSQTPDL
jgi:hypothetical protein